MTEIKKMKDEFDLWNSKKKILNHLQRRIFFKEGEIWWCSMGLNIGEEVYGKGDEFRRPVIILKKLSRNTCIVLPITTKSRNGNWYYYINAQDINRWIMMHQIRSISANRLYTRQATVSLGDFLELKKSLAELLGLFTSSPDLIPDQWDIPNVFIVYQGEEYESMIVYSEYIKFAEEFFKD